MNITLYSTPSEYNKLIKTLNTPLAKVGHLVDDSTIMNPVISLGYDANIITKNYCYIPSFNRYYFITEQTVSNKEIIVQLKCDVLMSWKDSIKNSNGRITRSGNMGNKYIVDDMVSMGNHFTTQVRKLGSGFTKADNYIMTVGGSN